MHNKDFTLLVVGGLIHNYITSEMLKLNDFPHIDIICANSGEEAIHYINYLKVNVVLTDIILPGFNGYELLKKIKEISDIPVIAQIYTTCRNEDCPYKREGFDDYIIKPFTSKEINMKIQQYLVK